MDLKTNVVDYLKTYYDTSHDIDIVLEEICKVCSIGICDNNQKIFLLPLFFFPFHIFEQLTYRPQSYNSRRQI